MADDERIEDRVRKGLRSLMRERCEIENYILHLSPEAWARAHMELRSKLIYPSLMPLPDYYGMPVVEDPSLKGVAVEIRHTVVA